MAGRNKAGAEDGAQEQEHEDAQAAGDDAGVTGAIDVQPGEASGGLEAAFASLRQAEAETDGARQVGIITDALSELSGEQRARFFAQPAVQQLIDRAAAAGAAAGLKPGSEIKDRHGRLVGKIPWTPQTMKEHYEREGHEMIEWRPHRDQFVSINGVGINVRAGVPVVSPPAFRDIHEESYQADLNARKTHEAIMAHHFGDFGVVLDLE